jgi:hypothetical protein
VPERLLVWLLRLGGVLTGSAFLAMVMPNDWMAATNRWLGLGELPRTPVFEYLARSVSAFYGFHGVLLLIVSRDPVYYQAIVRYVGWMSVAFGACLFAIDWHAGLPWWWRIGEGPGVLAIGVVVLSLARRLPHSRRA